MIVYRVIRDEGLSVLGLTFCLTELVSVGGVGGAKGKEGEGGGLRGGNEGESSSRRAFLRAIWKVILLVWNRRSLRLFHSEGKEKYGMFLRCS